MSKTTSDLQSGELPQNELIVIEALEIFLYNLRSDVSMRKMTSSLGRMFERIVLAKGQIALGNLQDARDHLKASICGISSTSNSLINVESVDDWGAEKPPESGLSMTELSIINCLRMMSTFLKEKKVSEPQEVKGHLESHLEEVERLSENVHEARKHLRTGIGKFVYTLELLIVPKEAP
jgi:hypothetical protein